MLVNNYELFLLLPT